MFKHIARLVFTLVFGLTLGGATNAQTPCRNCIWFLNEVYSNADGSVQFLLIQATRPTRGTLAGQTLVAGDGSTEHSFAFPADPPGQAGWILVATQGFADLHLVAPDFIVPNGFLFVFNGSVELRPGNWYEGTLRYAALPTDGAKALYPDADGESLEFTETAQATNSAGQSYIFPPAQKFSGLWWNAPSGSEPGWGIAVDHQGDTVFAAWATHDTDGSATWFVMPDARHIVPTPDSPFSYFGLPNTFLGDIYRMTGPALSVAAFDPSAVTAKKMGSGGFSFSTNADDVAFGNGNRSEFWFPIDSERGANKAITRQIFADPVPVCVEGAAPGGTPNFQGMWWNPAESGWGLHLTHQGDIVFALWLTYDARGKATWFTFTARKTAPNTYVGTIYRTTGQPFDATTYDPAAVANTDGGTATLTFADRNNGTFSFVCDVCGFDGLGQTESITRQVFADPPTVCN